MTGRPKPRVLLDYPQGPNTVEICESHSVFAVYYQGRPIKIRTRPSDMYNGFKYGKSSFPEAGHAIGLARKLNNKFNTTDFTVVELTVSRVFKVGK